MRHVRGGCISVGIAELSVRICACNRVECCILNSIVWSVFANVLVHKDFQTLTDSMATCWIATDRSLSLNVWSCHMA